MRKKVRKIREVGPDFSIDSLNGKRITVIKSSNNNYFYIKGILKIIKYKNSKKLFEVENKTSTVIFDSQSIKKIFRNTFINLYNIYLK